MIPRKYSLDQLEAILDNLDSTHLKKMLMDDLESLRRELETEESPEVRGGIKQLRNLLSVPDIIRAYKNGLTPKGEHA